MPGVPYPAQAKRGTRFNRMAAGSADLDQAGRRHSELGGPRPGAGRFAKSYRGPGGESIGGWNGTEWTGVASSDADLSYGAGRCARDCGIPEVVACRSALAS